MNSDVFAEWLRRQGHDVFRTASSYWVESGPRVYQAFPYHWVIEPDQSELDELLESRRAVALRYSSPFASPVGVASYHVVYTKRDYSLQELPKKARYDVRKGLNGAVIEPISFARLAEEGWALRVDTLQRQGRSGAEKRGWWETLCRSAEGLPGFEAWAATVDGRLAAALLAATCDDCCSILYQQSLTQYLSLGVNNALAFAFTSQVTKRTGDFWIFYGLHSLDAPSSVDEFKFRILYSAKAVRQRVVFHPWFAPLANRTSQKVLGTLLWLLPGNRFLAKTSGLLRFYLDGQLPVALQVWPKPLLQATTEQR